MDVKRQRRIQHDIELLHRNKKELADRGIFFTYNEANMCYLKILILPTTKSDADLGLSSPYAYGIFGFEITLQDAYPIEPPSISFHPRQHLCRFHPNYYENGKVCLSVINTWGRDWSPSTSLLSILYILEERLNEKALCFEPGLEDSNTETMKGYNTFVKYWTLQALAQDLPVFFHDFKDIVDSHLNRNADQIRELVHDFDTLHLTTIASPCYGKKPVQVHVDNLLAKLEVRLTPPQTLQSHIQDSPAHS